MRKWVVRVTGADIRRAERAKAQGVVKDCNMYALLIGMVRGLKCSVLFGRPGEFIEGPIRWMDKGGVEHVAAVPGELERWLRTGRLWMEPFSFVVEETGGDRR
jgi:hypothetical protein